MKRNLTLSVILFFTCQVFYSQTNKITGYPVAEIFTDFHLDLNDTSKTTGFGLNRAYLGYKFLTDNNFSGTIIINPGLPGDLAPESLPRRYAYFREASVSWSNEKLKFSFGITGTRLFDYQQKFWGKRYIANTYQSINGYGFVADLGIVMDYVFNDIVKVDVTLMNGEGYSNIQLDNSIRASLGFTLTPVKQFSLRLYGDLHRKNGLWQPMFISFIGFRNSIITIGAEVTYKSNLDLEEGHHAWGLSGTGSISLTDKTEFFARYDYSASVIASEAFRPWNYLNDGSLLITGFQYSPVENVKFALDYQGIIPYAEERTASKALYLNAMFKF